MFVTDRNGVEVYDTVRTLISMPREHLTGFQTLQKVVVVEVVSQKQWTKIAAIEAS